MIHNDIQNQLAFLIKTSAPPLINISQSSTELPQLVPGQQVPAHVIASLPNGRFQVMVENGVLDMNLPRNTQPGDTVDLVYVSDKPRPTFTLLSDLVKAMPQGTGNAVSLSQAGKLIGSLLQQQFATATTGNAANTTALTSTLPVIPGLPPTAQQFASALRDTVSQSGLFYESHQAQWVMGERSLETLLREPQAKLSQVLGGASNLTAPASAEAKTLVAAQTGIAPPSTGATQAQLLVIHGGAGDTAQTMTQNTITSVRDPVHPLAAPLVQQQLDLIDTRQIVWQGQVWPGQDMEWEIDGEGGRQGGDAEEAPMWSTRLHLDFPALGGVTAHLALGARGLKVDFSVERDQSATLMRGETASLAQAMEASGLTVAGIAVTGITAGQQDGNA